MSDNQPDVPKVTTKSTKKEMLDAYDKLVEQLMEKREEELKPAEKIEEKKAKEVIKTADSITTEEVVKKAADLKHEIGNTLSKLAEKLESEVAQYKTIKAAVENKRQELSEIFEIQKEAVSLAAMIEAQRQKRESFEAEMASRKEKLEAEIQAVRAEWEKEKKSHEMEVKERDALEQKRRDREKDDFNYNFQRDKQQAVDKFAAEKVAWEREWEKSKEEREKALIEREKRTAESEAELKELREKVKQFPQELNKAIDKTVKDATGQLIMESKYKEQLNLKEHEGEKKVFTTRIEALENTIKEHNLQIAKLSAQLEKSYGQVQDIAVKAVEGSSKQLNLANLGEMFKEQSRKSESGKAGN